MRKSGEGRVCAGPMEASARAHWLAPQRRNPASAGRNHDVATREGWRPLEHGRPARASSTGGAPVLRAPAAMPPSTQSAPAMPPAAGGVLPSAMPMAKGRTKPLWTIVQTVPFGPRSMARPMAIIIA